MENLDEKAVESEAQQLKTLIKQTIIESLNSQDDLGQFLEKWLARRLPARVLQR